MDFKYINRCGTHLLSGLPAGISNEICKQANSIPSVILFTPPFSGWTRREREILWNFWNALHEVLLLCQERSQKKKSVLKKERTNFIVAFHSHVWKLRGKLLLKNGKHSSGDFIYGFSQFYIANDILDIRTFRAFSLCISFVFLSTLTT